MTTDDYSHNAEELSDTPIPPGETIAEEIEYLGISRKELSDRTGIQIEMLDEILEGELPVSKEVAQAIERVLGISASLLVNLEARYQRTLERVSVRDKATLAG